MRAPGFWWRERTLASTLLFPVSALYSFFSARPFGKGERPKIPVLCVGNFVAGGAGKTPTCLALATYFQAQGQEIVFLTRGFGGTIKGPQLVSASKDVAQEVGDEPILLAGYAPTVVANDRVAGLRFIEQHLTPGLIIMDDGFQSARIMPNHALMVVDGGRGLGNGKVIPAGPLRAPLSVQLDHADSLLVIEGVGGNHKTTTHLIKHFEGRGADVHFATLVPREREDLAQKRIVAFSGIGHPQKFFDTVEAMGGELVSSLPFPDHHTFTQADAAKILEQAALFDAFIVTTAKDAVRLIGQTDNLGTLCEAAKVIEVELVFADAPTLSGLREKS